MKLSNVARVALLGCDTVEEASTLLRWAMTEHQTVEGAGPSSELVHIREQLKSAEKSIVTLQHANELLKPKRDGKCFVYYPNTFKHQTVARVVAMGTPSGVAVKLGSDTDGV